MKAGLCLLKKGAEVGKEAWKGRKAKNKKWQRKNWSSKVLKIPHEQSGVTDVESLIIISCTIRYCHRHSL